MKRIIIKQQNLKLYVNSSLETVETNSKIIAGKWRQR